MAVNHLTYSKAGLCLTERCEGLRCEAYQDQVGVWTIGYGHTGPDVHPGLVITQATAEKLLEQDISKAAHSVNTLVTVPLTQAEFDALVDFVFNLGTGAFLKSTLLTRLNSSDFSGAAEQFAQWDHAGGKVVAGLLARRSQEASLFQTVAGSDMAPGSLA